MTPMTRLNERGTRGRRWLGEDGLVAIMVGVHAVAFTVLCYLRYRSFFAYEWEDLAAANQIAFHTAKGRFFYQSITEQYFLAHFQPIYLLLALPYFVWPSLMTLQFLKCLALAAGAFPLAWLARERLKVRGAGALAAWIYLCYAPLNYLNVYDFRPVLLAGPILLFAYYFIERDRPWASLAACLLALCCKETVALPVTMLGLYAAYRNRRFMWGAGVVALGVAWLLVSAKFVIPLCLRDVEYPRNIGPFLHQWGGGDSLSEFVMASLLDPMRRLRVAFSEYRLHLLFKLLWPLCFLSLLSPMVLLMGLPGWAQTALSSHPYITNSRGHWYGITIVFLAAAAVHSIISISAWCSRRGMGRSRRVQLEAALLIALGAVSFLSNLVPNILGAPSTILPIHDDRFLAATNIYDRRFYAMDDDDREAWKILSLIPATASVSASGDLLPALSHRDKIVEFGMSLRYLSGKERDFTDADYIMIHARYLYNGEGDYAWPGRRRLRAMIQELLETNAWDVIKIDGLFVLLKRVPDARMSKPDVARILSQIDAEWAKQPRIALADLLDEARALIGAGDQAGAAGVLKRAIALGPRGPYAYYELGKIYSKTGRYAEAVAALREAVRRFRYNPIYWYDLAIVHEKRGELAAAETAIRRSIRLFPNRDQSHARLASILFARGRQMEGVRALERAVKLNPNALDMRLMLGRLYVSFGETDRAAREFTDIMRRDPAGDYGRQAMKELRDMGAGQD